MVWKYGDPIFLMGSELPVGTEEYDTWAQLAEIICGEGCPDETEDGEPFDIDEQEWEDE